jgi:RND family efflux transporter MFP subunit
VEALPARSGSLPLEEQLNGVVRARNQVAIRSEISGTVVDVFVRHGDPVTRGQPLVRLDDEALDERLRNATADLRRADATAAESRARVEEIRARVVRTRALTDSGLTSQLELETLEAQLAAIEAEADQTEAQVEQARATVQERRSALSKATLTSPVDGVVGRRDVEVGMVVGPSSTLFVVGDLDELIVEVPLTQDMLSTVDVGTPVEIDDRERDGDPLVARISRISPFLETDSFSTTAEVDVDDAAARLRPGMFVTVRVLYGASEQATLVPTSALWEDPLTGDWTVFVVADAGGLREPEAPGDEVPDDPRPVTQRPVEVLAEGRGRVALRGVDEGEWVVTVGQHLVHERLETTGADSADARVRPTAWAHVLDLQSLQREDLLEGFLAKQRVVARALGADLPESTAQVDEALRAAAADAGNGTR